MGGKIFARFDGAVRIDVILMSDVFASIAVGDIGGDLIGNADIGIPLIPFAVFVATSIADGRDTIPF